mmetsp:Transcript_11131/g.44837  ORF Transcript_11131/g.44837 Transcript_11131/m.44837 type:complete len:258 (-) Transcript_11131:159-932(-)
MTSATSSRLTLPAGTFASPCPTSTTLPRGLGVSSRLPGRTTVYGTPHSRTARSPRSCHLIVIESTALRSTAMGSAGWYPTDMPVTRTKRRTVPAFAAAVASLATPRKLTAAGCVTSFVSGAPSPMTSPILLILCAPKHATTWVHPSRAAASAASPFGPGSVTSPRASSTVPGGHASRSAVAAFEDGSRVSTRHLAPADASRRTTRAPTRPAPPTTRTSSSPSRSRRAGAGAASGAASGAVGASADAANRRVRTSDDG